VIQVPPAGQPIVLMADAQTTGGYPKIGVVISADLARLAQLRFNRTIQFVECDATQAREELRQDALYLQQIEAAMHWLRPAR
jgi:allophanate hydrolase subunit 2